MKATLEFNLDDFDDKRAHLRAVKSIDMALALWNIGDRLRTIEKHDEDKKFTREEFYELLKDNNIDLDEMIV